MQRFAHAARMGKLPMPWKIPIMDAAILQNTKNKYIYHEVAKKKKTLVTKIKEKYIFYLHEKL